MGNKPEYIKQLIKESKAFAFYRMPGEDEFSFITGEVMSVHSFDFINQRGFVFYPYEVEDDIPAYFISSDQLMKISSEQLNEIELHGDYLFTSGGVDTVDDYSSYYNRITALIQELKTGKAQKAILSRVHVRADKLENPFQLLSILAMKYAQAFVYMIHIPGRETWVGATPETLLRISGDIMQTVSVAATKALKDSRDWTAKEFEEQDLVTRYIEQIFKSHQVGYRKHGPDDYYAGNVMHLKTRFEALKPEQPQKLKAILQDLHPTPAVCGLPKTAAKSLIKSVEDHNRRYYSGFLGPVDSDSVTHLFVNIRCMKLLTGKQMLYIGGGITTRSEPEKEWNETIIKSHTLLDALENIS